MSNASKEKKEPKTPWNPSKTATARVKNPLPVPTVCNMCGVEGEISIQHHKAIYFGRVYGEWPWVYRCDCCEARVGMHPFTNIPLGTLADDSLRNTRKRCKAPFETLRKSGRISRDEAYSKLAEKLGIEKESCHFGWFDGAQCLAAMEATLQIMEEVGLR